MSYVSTGIGEKLVLESDGFASTGSRVAEAASVSIQNGGEESDELDTTTAAAMTVGGALVVGAIISGVVYLISRRIA